MMAAYKGHQECARLLLAARADPQISDRQGEGQVTALSLAQEGGHIAVLGLCQHAINQRQTPLPPATS